MTLLYLLASVLGGLGFFLSTPHQRGWPGAHAHRRGWRWLGCATSAVAATAAVLALGLWPGLFAALTSLMLTMVCLPYMEAWRQLRRERGDVG